MDEIIDYYSRPEISNSMLGNLKRKLNGTPQLEISKFNAAFGNLVHTITLEPKKDWQGSFYDSEIQKAGFMRDACEENSLFLLLMAHPEAEVEKEHFFTHERTGLRCKMKIDLKAGETIVDLKTTSCRTKKEFEASIIKYDYHRQAAFYLDHSGAKVFIFIAITKQPPFRTFTVIFKLNDPLIQQGREEYNYLLDVIKNEK